MVKMAFSVLFRAITDCLNCMNNKGLHVKFVVHVVYGQYLVTDSKVSFCVRTLMMA